MEVVSILFGMGTLVWTHVSKKGAEHDYTTFMPTSSRIQHVILLKYVRMCKVGFQLEARQNIKMYYVIASVNVRSMDTDDPLKCHCRCHVSIKCTLQISHNTDGWNQLQAFNRFVYGHVSNHLH